MGIVGCRAPILGGGGDREVFATFFSRATAVSPPLSGSGHRKGRSEPLKVVRLRGECCQSLVPPLSCAAYFCAGWRVCVGVERWGV